MIQSPSTAWLYSGIQLFRRHTIIVFIDLNFCISLDEFAADALLLRRQIYRPLHRFHEAHKDLLTIQH